MALLGTTGLDYHHASMNRGTLASAVNALCQIPAAKVSAGGMLLQVVYMQAVGDEPCAAAALVLHNLRNPLQTCYKVLLSAALQ